MGIFSFFRKKKAEQTSIIPANELEQAERLSNIESIGEEDISIEENTFEIVVPDNDSTIGEEELPPEIYEELNDYDPTKDLLNYYFSSIGLLKTYELLNTNNAEIEEIKGKIISILQANNIEIISIQTNIEYVNTLYEIISKAGFHCSKIKQYLF